MSDPMYDDSVWLEQIVQHNKLDVRWLLPFAIYRFEEQTERQLIDVTVILHDVDDQTFRRRLRIRWQPETRRFEQPPVQGNIITEFAACALAFALIPLYTRFYVTAVADEASRFDYWLYDGDNRVGLEVSGMISGNTQARRQQKIEQLLSNPFASDGYVCVLNFAQMDVHLSYHSWRAS